MTTGRVLHVVTDTDRRGAQSAALALHEQLLARGWSSRIAALAPGRVGGLEMSCLGAGGLHPTTLRALRREARGVDVVVAHGATTLPACAAALLGSTPFVYVNIGDPRAWLTSRSRLLRTRAALGRAAAVAAVSPQSARVLTDWVGVPGSKVRVLRNFRDPQRFRPRADDERRTARGAHGLPDDAPVVVWMGSLSREKRPDLAIDVARAMPGVTVVMAGGGPEAPRLTAPAREAGARMLGPIAEPERLLGAADALLLTSDTEGVPGVAIEAGLSGLPVASTRVGFVDDVVVDGETGRLAPAGDGPGLAEALRECLARAGDWGPAALAHCSTTFTPEVVVPAWEALLRDVIGR